MRPSPSVWRPESVLFMSAGCLCRRCRKTTPGGPLGHGGGRAPGVVHVTMSGTRVPVEGEAGRAGIVAGPRALEPELDVRSRSDRGVVVDVLHGDGRTGLAGGRTRSEERR